MISLRPGIAFARNLAPMQKGLIVDARSAQAFGAVQHPEIQR